jgi:hypothetical protein
MREANSKRVRRNARGLAKPGAAQGTDAQSFALLGEAPIRKTTPVLRQQPQRGSKIMVPVRRVSTPEQRELGRVGLRNACNLRDVSRFRRRRCGDCRR